MNPSVETQRMHVDFNCKHLQLDFNSKRYTAQSHSWHHSSLYGGGLQVALPYSRAPG